MVSTKFALLATAAALSEVVVASPHKLLHHVRDEVVTIYQTVYVNAPVAPAATAVPEPVVVPEVKNNAVYQETKPETKPETKGTTTEGAPKVKRGTIFNNAEYGSAFLGKCGDKCGWFHNWESSFAGDAHGASFVPTMWGLKDDHIAAWPAGWKKSYDSGSRNFFSFNEPDVDPNLVPGDVAQRQEPATAISNHVQYFSALPKDARIATPSVTNGKGSILTGLQWLKAFVEGCNADSNCRFDFCNVHFYTDFKWLDATIWDHLKEASDVCNTGNTGPRKKIWLSEFRSNENLDNDNKAEWLKKSLSKLDGLEYLEAYSWYWAAPVVPTGGYRPGFMSSLTELLADGQVYATA